MDAATSHTATLRAHGMATLRSHRALRASHALFYEGDVAIRILDPNRLLALRILANVIDTRCHQHRQILPDVTALAFTRHINGPDFLRRTALDRRGILLRRELQILFIHNHRHDIFAKSGKLGRRRILNRDGLIDWPAL